MHALLTLCISRSAWLSPREQERERGVRQVSAQRECQVLPLHLMHANLLHSEAITCEQCVIFEGFTTFKI